MPRKEPAAHHRKRKIPMLWNPRRVSDVFPLMKTFFRSPIGKVCLGTGAGLAVAAVVFVKTVTDRHRHCFGMYDDLIEQASIRHDVDPCLIRAVIKKESRFNAGARGKHKEVGLMQITAAVATDWEKATC